MSISPSIGIYLQDDTSDDRTHTTLDINITVDYFRDRSYNYSCQLVLAENGRPSGSISSEIVTVDPVGEWVYAYMYMHSVFYSI